MSCRNYFSHLSFEFLPCVYFYLHVIHVSQIRVLIYRSPAFRTCRSVYLEWSSERLNCSTHPMYYYTLSKTFLLLVLLAHQA